jgi:hypothetical protein
MGVETIELEIRRQAAAEFSQAGEKLPGAGLARDLEFALADHMNLDFRAFFQTECFDHGSGKPNG